MSVFVQNGISVLKSSAGHALRFKGSEDDPVLLQAKLEDCDQVGPRLRGATRPSFSRRVVTMVADMADSANGVIEVEPSEPVAYIARGGGIAYAAAQWLEPPVGALGGAVPATCELETATGGDVFLAGATLTLAGELETFTADKTIGATEKVKVSVLANPPGPCPVGEGVLLITLVIDSFQVADVTGALTAEYDFHGYVGSPDPEEGVVFIAAAYDNDVEVRTATSAADGTFTITGLRAGKDYNVYQDTFGPVGIMVARVNETTVQSAAAPILYAKQDPE